mmetsp:Transcript_20772/g.23484  ORF Transcript_20772/g.23484 Transcript_20772/m.23484 type:complete len:314 (+) Transcript_20772:74-1015(+)
MHVLSKMKGKLPRGVNAIKSIGLINMPKRGNFDYMGEKLDFRLVRNFKESLYTPTQELEFQNGKMLLYEYHHNALKYPMAYGSYILTMGILVSLVRIHPFAYSFPVSMPLYFLGLIVVCTRFSRYTKHHKNVIQRIHLLEDGTRIEIEFLNTFRREIFSKPRGSIQMFNEQMISPPLDETAPLSARYGALFPTEEEDIRPEDPSLDSYAWLKFFGGWENFFLMPKNYYFMNKEVLSQVFNGKNINISNSNSRYRKIKKALERRKRIEKAVSQARESGEIGSSPSHPEVSESQTADHQEDTNQRADTEKQNPVA